MERLTIEVGSYGVNCSILSRDGLVCIVDPGQEGDRILDIIAKKGLVPSAILLTHAHFDHITGIATIQKAYPDLPVYAHKADFAMFGHPYNQLPPEYTSIGTPKNLMDVKTFASGDISIIHTPGHTPGGVCYYLKNDSTLLSGDTLFAGSIGRTDFPGGSLPQMLESLKRLVELPEDTVVIPGHGKFTTIGQEKQQNPYIT